MVLIAHAGHVLTSIAYFVPVVAFLIWLLVTQIRGRGRGRGERQAAEAGSVPRPATSGVRPEVDYEREHDDEPLEAVDRVRAGRPHARVRERRPRE